MANEKKCFMNAERPCDLTCKAAFEVDDPVDNVDCYFIWLSLAMGEGLYEVRKVLEGFAGFGFPPMPGGMGGTGGADADKGNKGDFPNN